MEIKDLSLLNQNDIKLKFGEDAIFSIPADPTLEFTYKLVEFEEKVAKAKSNREQFDLMIEMVTLILGQDQNNKVTKDFIKKNLRISQVEAVIKIYMEQIAKNNDSPN